MVHGEDFVERVFVGIDVDHPAENDRMKTAASGVAGFLSGDGAPEAKLAHVGVVQLAFLRHAKIGMQMPHGHAQRHAFVELLLGGALGHGVHRADKFVTLRSLLVEQGSRARGIKGERFEEAIHIFREVIFRLRQIRQENFVTVVQRDVVVLVLFDAGAKLRDDFIGARGIRRSLRAHGRHVHVQAVRVYVPGSHVVNGARFVGWRRPYPYPACCCGPCLAISETVNWTTAGHLAQALQARDGREWRQEGRLQEKARRT